MIECKVCMYVQYKYSQKVNKARDVGAWGRIPPIDGTGLINGSFFFFIFFLFYQKRSRFKLVVIY